MTRLRCAHGLLTTNRKTDDMSKYKRLRELIDAPEILVMPGIFDGFSARLIEPSGFASGFISGAGISEATLGWADQGIMGLEENRRVARALAACCDLPIIADADTGYGNAVNVHFIGCGFEQRGSCRDHGSRIRCGQSGAGT